MADDTSQNIISKNLSQANVPFKTFLEMYQIWEQSNAIIEKQFKLIKEYQILTNKLLAKETKNYFGFFVFLTGCIIVLYMVLF